MFWQKLEGNQFVMQLPDKETKLQELMNQTGKWRNGLHEMSIKAKNKFKVEQNKNNKKYLNPVQNHVRTNQQWGPWHEQRSWWMAGWAWCLCCWAAEHLLSSQCSDPSAGWTSPSEADQLTKALETKTKTFSKVPMNVCRSKTLKKCQYDQLFNIPHLREAPQWAVAPENTLHTGLMGRYEAAQTAPGPRLHTADAVCKYLVVHSTENNTIQPVRNDQRQKWNVTKCFPWRFKLYLYFLLKNR